MKVALLFTPLLLLSCTKVELPKKEIHPYSGLIRNNFVTDLTLKKTEPPNGLKELLLTLPIFETEPTSRREFVENYGTIKGQTLFVQGDGAQDNLTLIKLNKSSRYRLIIEESESATLYTYELERSDHIGYGYDGWHILSSSVKEI